jgi:hypothetical protein
MTPPDRDIVRHRKREEKRMDSGLLGGVIGGSLGLLGGIVGTYFSIKNTSGPDERAFMVRMSIATWVLVTAFVCGLMLLPAPYGFLLWIPYGIALALAIRWSNRRQAQIRTRESA